MAVLIGLRVSHVRANYHSTYLTTQITFWRKKVCVQEVCLARSFKCLFLALIKIGYETADVNSNGLTCKNINKNQHRRFEKTQDARKNIFLLE